MSTFVLLQSRNGGVADSNPWGLMAIAEWVVMFRKPGKVCGTCITDHLQLL